MCKYCEEGEETTYEGYTQINFTPINETVNLYINSFYLCKENGKYQIVFDGAVGTDIYFCPMCGKKLGGVNNGRNS